jgi:hypothetical protein
MIMKFPETTERFVAYFDIMGFKDLIYRSDHSAVSAILSKVSNTVADIKEWEVESLKKDARGRKKWFDKGIVLPVLFSDSVLFVSRTNTIFDARKAAYSASFFLYQMFSACIPVKGTLAYGTFTADFGASKFFGRPLVDAYLLAEEVHFYGAVLHHSFEKYLHDQNEGLPEIILKRKPVPMKGGSVTHSFIDWRSHLGKEVGQESLIEPFYRSVSGSTRRYVDNTRLVYTVDS